MKLIIRTTTEIEIVLPEGVASPTVGAAAEQAPVTENTAGSSAANPSARSAPPVSGLSCGISVENGLKGDGDPVLTVEVGPAVAGAARLSQAILAATPANILKDDPDVAAALATIRDQVRAAVDNPPAPVEPPVELDLRRRVEDDDLAIPLFLKRATA